MKYLVALILPFLMWGSMQAQGRGAAGTPAAPPAPRAAAPSELDLTGYWVSIVSEDWRWRMVTPAKGDYASVPLTPEGKRVADTWDPAKDEAAGEPCRSYGAPGLMRIPGRLRISWLDDTTLKVETDAGIQTRLFHFRSRPARGPRTWQGESVAEWVIGGGQGRGAPAFGSMKTVTTRLRAGYLRKNGVPYSENTVLTEYWDVHTQKNGDQWLVVTSLVEDPVYLQMPFLTALHFKKERDGSKWDPSPCSARW